LGGLQEVRRKSEGTFFSVVTQLVVLREGIRFEGRLIPRKYKVVFASPQQEDNDDEVDRGGRHKARKRRRVGDYNNKRGDYDKKAGVPHLIIVLIRAGIK
jgi:hypothetical protein